MRRIATVIALAGALQLAAQDLPWRAVGTPYADAKPIFDALDASALPPELAARPEETRRSLWLGWLKDRNTEIRSRLERGDEDSVVNFLLFGTSFTTAPRATEHDVAAMAQDPARAQTAFAQRVEDLVNAVASPGSNERLLFVRQLTTKKGIALETSAGRELLRTYLRQGLSRVANEVSTYDNAIEAAATAADPSVEFIEKATLFRNRGLSSDTSLFTDHAIDQALQAINANGLLGAESVTSVGIVGPGLDFTDKHEGFDFYPPQVIQPFAVIDSLARTGLATLGHLQVVTLDLSPRVNQHLSIARQQAQAGHAYTLQLPRDTAIAWHPDLAHFWETFGQAIGRPTAPIDGPETAGPLQSRAIAVQPSVVLLVTPQDVNIVTETLQSRDPSVKFDLVIATNILIYYNAFEQALALANIAKMLRPGGVLLANGRALLLPGIPLTQRGQRDVIYTYQPGIGEVGDRVVWYQRQ